jgi:hypothetical protein
VIVFWLRYYPTIYLEWLRKTTKILIKDSRNPDRDFKRAPPEFMSGTLTLNQSVQWQSCGMRSFVGFTVHKILLRRSYRGVSTLCREGFYNFVDPFTDVRFKATGALFARSAYEFCRGMSMSIYRYRLELALLLPVLSFTASSAVHARESVLWIVSSRRQLSAPIAVCSHKGMVRSNISKPALILFSL